MYFFGMTGPVGQLVRGSESCSYTTDMGVKFEGCLFCHDDDVGVVCQIQNVATKLTSYVTVNFA